MLMKFLLVGGAIHSGTSSIGKESKEQLVERQHGSCESNCAPSGAWAHSGSQGLVFWKFQRQRERERERERKSGVRKGGEGRGKLL